MNTNSLQAERQHLANLLEAAQRHELRALQAVLIKAAGRLLAVCLQSIDIRPATPAFELEFQRACAALMPSATLALDRKTPQ